MTSIREMAAAARQRLSAPFRKQQERTAIDSLAKLQDFIASRSVYVAQKLLLDYVKTRMGERYMRVFEDERLVASINILQLNLLAACLSDLTIYAVATVLGERPDNEADRMARACYVAALHDVAGDAPTPFSVHQCIGEFVRRLADTDWRAAARRPGDFIRNPNRLVRRTPVTDRLKKFEGDTLENAVKFTWFEIRGGVRRAARRPRGDRRLVAAGIELNGAAVFADGRKDPEMT